MARERILVAGKAITSGTSMSNPWLEIPLSDYERHMSLPEIRQAQMLGDYFARLIKRYRPTSVAVIGCTGGNGFERIEAGEVRRVVAVDINPQYLEAVTVRHGKRLACIEVHCVDVQSGPLRFEPVDLIYAALLFEYVDVPSALATLKGICRPGGTLATVLQLPNPDLSAVSPSPYRSMDALAPVIRLVAPEDLCAQADAVGFRLVLSDVIALPSGKSFALQILRA